MVENLQGPPLNFGIGRKKIKWPAGAAETSSNPTKTAVPTPRGSLCMQRLPTPRSPVPSTRCSYFSLRESDGGQGSDTISIEESDGLESDLEGEDEEPRAPGVPRLTARQQSLQRGASPGAGYAGASRPFAQEPSRSTLTDIERHEKILQRRALKERQLEETKQYTIDRLLSRKAPSRRAAAPDPEAGAPEHDPKVSCHMMCRLLLLLPPNC